MIINHRKANKSHDLKYHSTDIGSDRGSVSKMTIHLLMYGLRCGGGGGGSATQRNFFIRSATSLRVGILTAHDVPRIGIVIIHNKR